MEVVWRAMVPVQLVLVPVVLGVVLALVRGNSGRAVFALAVAAVVLLLAGVGFYDLLTGVRSVAVYSRSQSPEISVVLVTLNLDAVHIVVAAGEAVLVAATALALHDAARARRWKWFAALMAAQVLATVFLFAFNQGLDLLLFLYGLWGPIQERLDAGDPGVSAPYYLVTSALVAASPLVALLYGLRSGRSAAAAETAA